MEFVLIGEENMMNSLEFNGLGLLESIDFSVGHHPVFLTKSLSLWHSK